MLTKSTLLMPEPHDKNSLSHVRPIVASAHGGYRYCNVCVCVCVYCDSVTIMQSHLETDTQVATELKEPLRRDRANEP